MTFEHAFYCALVGGLIAAGFGCGGDDYQAPPPKPLVKELDEYSTMTMANGRTQVYGATTYTFRVSCGGTTLSIASPSTTGAVWFDHTITQEPAVGSSDLVEITPDEDSPWSARVEFKCSSGNSSESTFMNFCYQGPCSDEDKP